MDTRIYWPLGFSLEFVKHGEIALDSFVHQRAHTHLLNSSTVQVTPHSLTMIVKTSKPLKYPSRQKARNAYSR